ncbi:MAG: Ig-like domain-containing protein [Actinomycetota bacterium]|nr:Ig-like domain-containing protein [Actinomycetota bacterium]
MRTSAFRGAAAARDKRKAGARLAAAVVAVVAAAVTGFTAPASAATLSDKLVPSAGAFFGVYSGPPRAGRTWGQEMPYLERLIGRKYDLDRWYYFWDEAFPTWHEKDAVAAGRIPIISWTADLKSNRTPLKFSAIANGSYDAAIRARADALKAFGHKVMLIFHHEPEDDLNRNGTGAEYRAAWRRVVTLFRERGATNVVWVWNIMAWTFNPSGPVPEDYYPGDDVVDWVAADGYNWYGNPMNPGPWREFSEIFYHFNAWVNAKGKPAMVAEVGSGEDTTTPDPQRKARWFANAAATIKTWPLLKGIIYFNALGWYFDSSTASLAAYKTVGLDPYFNPRTTTTTTSVDTTKPTVSITSPANGSSVTSRTTVRIAASASDNIGVAKVEFWVNGSRKCTDSTASYTCDWYVWNNPGATNWIRVVAFDAAGNTAEHRISVGTK